FIVENKDAYHDPVLNYATIGPYWVRYNIPKEPVRFIPDERIVLSRMQHTVNIASTLLSNEVAAGYPPLKDGLQFFVMLSEGDDVILNGSQVSLSNKVELFTSGGYLNFSFYTLTPGQRNFTVTFPQLPDRQWDFVYETYPDMEISSNDAISYNTLIRLKQGDAIELFFNQKRAGEVGVRFYDISGTLAGEIPVQYYEAGYNRITWYNYGSDFPGGRYYAVISGNNWRKIRKLLIVRK
ncbi:MAG TPA: hypothetical protein VKS21_11000, partial [Spirochaetota bacterium]|nr:hypothetical protein [Spirochaetota bacterium]